MIKHVYMFPNGNTAVFDDSDSQMPELQKGWLETWIEHLVSKGVNPEGLTITMPNQRIATVFKIPGGWNWSIS